MRNGLHYAANQIVAFWRANSLTILCAGDLGTLSHKKWHRRFRRTHQEVGTLEFGPWEQYLEYKRRRQGIQLAKISEVHTSQMCPPRSHPNKVAGRRLLSQLLAIRHIVMGCAVNKGTHGGILVATRITYRHPVSFRGTSERSGC